MMFIFSLTQDPAISLFAARSQISRFSSLLVTPLKTVVCDTRGPHKQHGMRLTKARYLIVLYNNQSNLLVVTH